MGYATIRDVIQCLQNETNQDQPIIFEYFLAAHFDGCPISTFETVAKNLNSQLPLSQDEHQEIYGDIKWEIGQ